MRDFEHTVNVLVKAYMNDTLEHENCAACAVGNIICAAGIDLNSNTDLAANAWYHAIQKLVRKSEMYCFSHLDKVQIGLNQIEATGYSINELNRIESAFESEGEFRFDGVKNEDRMFNGLMKVVDVLADIHGIDLKAKEEAKLLFVKA